MKRSVRYACAAIAIVAIALSGAFAIKTGDPALYSIVGVCVVAGAYLLRGMRGGQDTKLEASLSSRGLFAYVCFLSSLGWGWFSLQDEKWSAPVVFVPAGVLFLLGLYFLVRDTLEASGSRRSK